MKASRAGADWTGRWKASCGSTRPLKEDDHIERLIDNVCVHVMILQRRVYHSEAVGKSIGRVEVDE